MDHIVYQFISSLTNDARIVHERQSLCITTGRFRWFTIAFAPANLYLFVALENAGNRWAKQPSSLRRCGKFDIKRMNEANERNRMCALCTVHCAVMKVYSDRLTVYGWCVCVCVRVRVPYLACAKLDTSDEDTQKSTRTHLHIHSAALSLTQAHSTPNVISGTPCCIAHIHWLNRITFAQCTCLISSILFSLPFARMQYIAIYIQIHISYSMKGIPCDDGNDYWIRKICQCVCVCARWH